MDVYFGNVLIVFYLFYVEWVFIVKVIGYLKNLDMENK